MIALFLFNTQPAVMSAEKERERKREREIKFAGGKKLFLFPYGIKQK